MGSEANRSAESCCQRRKNFPNTLMCLERIIMVLRVDSLRTGPRAKMMDLRRMTRDLSWLSEFWNRSWSYRDISRLQMEECREKIPMQSWFHTPWVSISRACSTTRHRFSPNIYIPDGTKRYYRKCFPRIYCLGWCCLLKMSRTFWHSNCRARGASGPQSNKFSIPWVS